MSKLHLTIGLVLMTLAAALSAAGRQTGARPPYRLSLPGESWALDLDLSAFNVPAAGNGLTDMRPAKSIFFWVNNPVESVSDDGRAYQLSAFRQSEQKGRANLTHLWIKLGPARGQGSAADLREYVLKNLSKRSQLKGGGAKTSEYNGIPVASYKQKYTLDSGNPLSGPIPVVNYGPPTLEAYFVKDDTWITVTLSARDFKEPEEKLFYALLDSVKFTDTSAPSTSFDYYHKGRVLYLAGDYGKAAEALTMALSLEQKQRRLDTDSWRRLVSNLVDSYGGSNDMARAKELLDYAVASDPTYPVFQLALARYYAWAGDLDKSLAYLEQAYRNRENAPTRLPDPSYDPAFERFKKDDRFRKAVKAYKK
jgi:tetratricopeptide (TPR) repeat protein